MAEVNAHSSAATRLAAGSHGRGRLCTPILRRYGGFQARPVTGSPATCVRHVSIRHQGLARRSAGKCHTAITNEVSDFTKIAGEILLERLIVRSIDVRRVEHEQVDASTGGTSICPSG
eukprot:CAMPEP_0174731068 /NCGR_PEP_ID=MMETSP1094-20130205/56842_1 /TAXON_ID=156173 /ORGANISM="Chrysochromulina brevifilum, Strain UTEX LB 985" /LENGTH=117 /DNA_ID=CAMNT_0015933415 /DNA_START=210 /DNA_END=560 /DNA_ORIENTATION=+